MKQSLQIESTMATDPGLVRQANEDSVGFREPETPIERIQKGTIWVIADGVGTQLRGQQASRLAAHTIVDAYWSSAVPEVMDRLRVAIERTNALLYAQNSPDA